MTRYLTGLILLSSSWGCCSALITYTALYPGVWGDARYRYIVLTEVDVTESSFTVIPHNGQSHVAIAFIGGGLSKYCQYYPSGTTPNDCTPPAIRSCYDAASAVRALKGLVGQRYNMSGWVEYPLGLQVEFVCGNGRGQAWRFEGSGGGGEVTPVQCTTTDTILALDGVVGEANISSSVPAWLTCTGKTRATLTLAGNGVVQLGGGVLAKLTLPNGGAAMSLDVNGETSVTITAVLGAAPGRAGEYTGSTILTTAIE